MKIIRDCISSCVAMGNTKGQAELGLKGFPLYWRFPLKKFENGVSANTSPSARNFEFTLAEIRKVCRPLAGQTSKIWTLGLNP